MNYRLVVAFLVTASISASLPAADKVREIRLPAKAAVVASIAVGFDGRIAIKAMGRDLAWRIFEWEPIDAARRNDVWLAASEDGSRYTAALGWRCYDLLGLPAHGRCDVLWVGRDTWLTEFGDVREFASSPSTLAVVRPNTSRDGSLVSWTRDNGTRWETLVRDGPAHSLALYREALYWREPNRWWMWDFAGRRLAAVPTPPPELREPRRASSVSADGRWVVALDAKRRVLVLKQRELEKLAPPKQHAAP